MKNLKRVVITTAIVCGIVSMSGCQKKENESKEITWAKSSEVVDNTDEHLQNMYEKYQLKKDYMLYLKAKNLEEGGTLYQIERNGKQQIQLLDGDGCVDMIDFDKKKVKKIVSQTECANDAVACTKDAVYYGVDSYNMNDVLQKEKIQSKNNGLWKFYLQTGNKEKIREQSPKELHVLGNKVYDETLKEVRKGENK